MSSGSLSKDFMVENGHTVRAQAEMQVLSKNQAFEQLLINYGLPEHERELLLDKYVANLSYREIADKQGWVDHKQARKVLLALVTRLSKSVKFKNLLLGGKNG